MATVQPFQPSTSLRLLAMWLCLMGSGPTAFGQNESPIFDLARAGDVGGMEDLLRVKPQAATLRDANGYSPLILAAYHGCDSTVKVLTAYGDVNYVSSYGTALMGAAVKGHEEIAACLLQADADPNLADADGNTPLIYAAMFEHEAIVRLLLAHKADPKQKNKKGFSAVDYANRQKNTPLIILFDHHLQKSNE